MMSYPKWLESSAKGNDRRLTYAAGVEAKLREGVVRAIREEDAELVTVWAGTDDQEVWAELNTHPMRQSQTKIVTVRNAHRIKDWSLLDSWLRDMRTVKCVMESGVPEFSLPLARKQKFCPREHSGPVNVQSFKSGKVKRTCSVCDTAKDMLSKRGRLVVCQPPTTDAARKAFVTMLSQKHHASRVQVEQLLSHTGWRIDPALEVLQKLELLQAPLTMDLVQLLGVSVEDTRFEVALKSGDRGKAVSNAHLVHPSEVPNVLNRCEHWLSQIARVSRSLKAGQTTSEIANAIGADWGWAMKLSESAGRYDVAAVNRATMALANAERDWYRGARTGVLEVMGASW
jgi:hypothetical protein